MSNWSIRWQRSGHEHVTSADRDVDARTEFELIRFATANVDAHVGARNSDTDPRRCPKKTAVGNDAKSGGIDLYFKVLRAQ